MAGDGRRRALIVGIDDYEDDPLAGCVEDAARMKDLLSQHGDGRPNYATRTLKSDEREIDRATLREALGDFFSGATGYDLLFYFAGHGAVTGSWGGELVTSDYSGASGGVAMRDVAALANGSNAREIVIILDCCFSGRIADLPPDKPVDRLLEQAQIREDLSIMAASRQSQAAFGDDTGGFFTSTLVRGLEGAAADVFGHVTPLGIHECVRVAFAQDSAQRPVFKSYFVHPPILREVEAKISIAELRRLLELFPDPAAAIAITSAHVGSPGADPTEAQRDFGDLSKLSALGMIEVEGFRSISHAADNGEIIKLSALGRYYWELLDDDRLRLG